MRLVIATGSGWRAAPRDRRAAPGAISRSPRRSLLLDWRLGDAPGHRSRSTTCWLRTWSRCSSSWGRCRRCCCSRYREMPESRRDRSRCRSGLPSTRSSRSSRVNAGFIVWHVAPAYDAALAHWWLYDLMQATPAARVAALLVADRDPVLTRRADADRVRQAGLHRARHDPADARRAARGAGRPRALPGLRLRAAAGRARCDDGSADRGSEHRARQQDRAASPPSGWSS